MYVLPVQEGKQGEGMSENKDWLKICADCHEGYQPNDCEHYGEPRGCNAPTYGGPPPRYYAELRDENARLRAALKHVLGAKRGDGK